MSIAGTVLAVDVGNTRIKASLFDEGKQQHAFSISTRGEDLSLDKVLAREIPSRPDGVILASVVRGMSDVWEMAVKRVWGLNLIVTRADLPIGIEVDVPCPDAVGIDRLLMAGAAYAEVGGATVIVGVGTAITVDVVSGDGVYIGGTISPGLRVSAWALAEQTSLLPEIDLDDEDGGLPKSTTDGIRTGVLVGSAGMVDRLVRELAARAGLSDYACILTGGDGGLLSPYLETEHTLSDDLVMKGLEHTYRRLSEG